MQTRQVYNLEKIKILHTGKEKAISVIQAIKDKKKKHDSYHFINRKSDRKNVKS